MVKNGKNKSDGFLNRQQQEDGEKLDTVSNDAPANRVQPNGQLADVADAKTVKTAPASGVEIKSESVPAQTVHTTKVAELVKEAKGLTAGSGGGNGAFGLRMANYSGNSGIVSDMSATTRLNKDDRSATRIGKKLDNTMKHINYLANEQVEVKYDESKPLAENPEATQGYNGTYRNAHARTQKNSGFVPGDLYYDRSIDEIHQDFVYYVMGQSINDPAAKRIPSYDDKSPTKYTDMLFNRGSHLHTKLTVGFNKDGVVTTFKFGDYDITPDPVDADVADLAAVNAVIDANTAELDRQVMDSKAGNELSPEWNPLPRSIKDPTDTIALLRDIEASTGAETFMAYKKTAMAMSYQLSKAAKDGQRITEPITEMLTGCMDDTVSDVTVIGSAAEYEDAFTVGNYRAGSPAVLIKLFDSVTKYKTKGDFLLQPRGFRMHLQTADNNMNPLRVPINFVKAVNANEVFSTIDRDYDAFLPTCVSDKASLAHPYSFNTFIKDNKPIAFKYSYANGSNNVYIMEVYHPLVKGLYEFFTRYGAAFRDMLSDKSTSDTDEVQINIPCMHATTCFSLWSLLLLAATPDIIKARLTSFIDVFDYENNFGYPFRQLVSLKEANPMAASNYGNPDYNEPLTVGRMKPGTAFKWVFPETYWIVSENGSTPKIVMPWYHNENQYIIDGSNLLRLSDNPSIMSFPSVRSGNRFSFLDTIYGMSEQDVRLCLDRQVVYPCYKKNKNTTLDAYKYGLATDGQIVVTLDENDFNYQNIMKTPREMGWICPAPNGMLTQLVTKFTDVEETTSRIAFNGSMATYAPGSFRIRYWHGVGSAPTTILADASINVNRAMSLKQDFITIVAQRMIDNYAQYINNDYILALSLCYDGTGSNINAIEGRSVFTPFTSNSTPYAGSDQKVVTMQKYYWTRFRLPFAINPFDCCPTSKVVGKDDGVKADPYDFLYIFGLAGFRASDYNEDSYNRLKERLNLGMSFISDPYFMKSLTYRAD